MERGLKLYREAMGYMTRAEGVETKQAPEKDGDVKVETVNHVTRLGRDFWLPDHLGHKVNLLV